VFAHFLRKNVPKLRPSLNNRGALWRCRVVGPFLHVAMLVAFTDCARRQQNPDSPALNCPKCLPAFSCRSHRASLRREVNPATGRFVPQRDVASSRLGGRLARRRGVPAAPSELSCSIASVQSGTPADRFYGRRVGRVGYKQVSRIRLVAEPAGKVHLVEDGRYAIVDGRDKGRWLERL
jgi:hypothetical protein